MAVKIFEIKKSVYENNDREAEILRGELKSKGVFLLNVMSAPGSGKTTLLLRTIEALKEQLNIGVIEADIDSAVDAEKVAKTGVRTVQLHTGGMCHLDAGMVRQGLDNLGIDGLDLVILENVGNLVCPAEFDTGASKQMMLLSVPEGDDKPLKYPLMFSEVDALVVSKIDCQDYFDFDADALKDRAKKLNSAVEIFELSAKTGQNVAQWTDWLHREVMNWKEA
ncbi:MAG: hydrogenase nickel incorporation protein HypB [Oscillospiraceae bacterium]|nr:hydrogenase nickel incorporation protein HypB [Oscillospiraceae bacterium]